MMMVSPLSLSVVDDLALISLLSTVDDDDEVKALLTTTTTKPLQTTTTTTTSAPKRKEKGVGGGGGGGGGGVLKSRLSLSLSFRKWTTKALSTTLNFVCFRKSAQSVLSQYSLSRAFFLTTFSDKK